MTLSFSIFLISITSTFGFRQTSTDSLVSKWHLVEAGRLEMPDSIRTQLLFDIGEGMSYDTPDSAIDYYQKALVLSKKGDYIQLTGNILNKVGYANYILGNYDLALTYYVEALEIHQQLKNDIGIAMSLNNISMIYETQKNLQQALQYQWRSIVHAIRSNDLTRLTSNYFNLSIIHDGLKDYDSALFYLERSLHLSNETENHHLYSMALNRRGEVYLHVGKYEEAAMSYKQVLDSKNYQNSWENCFAYAGLAKVNQRLGHYDKSIEYGLISLAIARQMNSKWEIAQDAHILYESYKAKNDFVKALEMHEFYKQYSDSLFSETKEKEINFLHLKQNELERARLAKENELNKVIIKQSYIWIVFFAIIGIILTIWGVILYRNNRHKQILNKRLTIKNQNIADRNEKIEKQNVSLNELNETKNQLLSIIGHDMRGPINNIKAILEIIKEGGLDEVEQKRIFNDLYKTIENVSGTMNNMLAWASRQLNGIQIHPTQVSLCEVVNSLMDFFSQSANEKRIEMIHNRNESVHVWFDVDHLKTILRNILSNAIKFTNRNGRITVTYQVDHGFAKLVVADTGIGIDAKDIKDVFRFSGRSKSLGTDNERGTGIGLMLSKEFIERNGGQIEVSSKLGMGSEFTLYLPIIEIMKENSAMAI